jgi:hypothetical protein
MKKFVVLFLAALTLMFSACANGEDKTVSPTADPQQSEVPSPTATPVPDFTGTDFSGRWYVYELIDSNGMPATEAEKQNLGAGFTLELLPNGTYFVYDQDSKVLGQGTYSVALNQLVLTANGAESAYEIVDADTFRMTQPDTSITVMKREAQETAGDDEIISGENTGSNEEGDTEDEPAEDSTATPEQDDSSSEDTA